MPARKCAMISPSRRGKTRIPSFSLNPARQRRTQSILRKYSASVQQALVIDSSLAWQANAAKPQLHAMIMKIRRRDHVLISNSSSAK